MGWDINQVTLIGRLTRDTELRYSKSGVAICPIGLAVNRAGRKDTSQEDEVYYFDIITFGKTAELSNSYLTKGQQIGVQGYLRQNRWEDQSGGKRSKVEIVADRIQFLSPSQQKKELRAERSVDEGSSRVDMPETKENGNNLGEFEADDDIPF